MNVFTKNKQKFGNNISSVMTLKDFLKSAKADSSFYANAAQRMVKAIGDPKAVDTSKNERLRRIHGGRIIQQYETFSEFFGMEDTIQRVVDFFKHAAQGLEASRQILYLLGPVGSAKSSLAEKLKELICKHPIYVLAVEDKSGLHLSPINESP